MKRRFICTVVTIILCGRCLAVSDDLLRAFDKALSDPDISVCWDAAAPLWGRAQGEGFFAKNKEPSNLLSLMIDRVLDKRIDIEDREVFCRFERDRVAAVGCRVSPVMWRVGTRALPCVMSLPVSPGLRGYVSA